jgi:large repetitive protein
LQAKPNTAANANAAPIFDKLDNFTIPIGQPLQFRAFALDPDNPGYIPQEPGLNGQLTLLEGTRPSVTYTASNLPPGAIFDATTGLFSWTPNLTAAGNYSITFTATDDGNNTGVAKTSTVVVPIKVVATNRLPIFTPIANRTLTRGEVLNIPIIATDADGNSLTLTASGLTGYNLPDFATFIDTSTPLSASNGNGTGILRLNPDLNTDAGNYTINLTATENRPYILGEEHTSTTNFVISVDAPNDRPKFNLYQGDTILNR